MDPVTMPTDVGFSITIHSIPIQTRAAVAAAKCVARSAEPAEALAARIVQLLVERVEISTTALT